MSTINIAHSPTNTGQPCFLMKQIILLQVRGFLEQRCMNEAIKVLAQLYKEHEMDDMFDHFLLLLEEHNVTLKECDGVTSQRKL
jgi:hypothetical protein